MRRGGLNLNRFRGKKILILMHHNADIDAVSSSMALFLGFGKLRIKSQVGVAKGVSKRGNKILDAVDLFVNVNPDVSKYDVVFILDTCVPEQLEPMDMRDAKSLIIIDHHETAKIRGNIIYSWLDKNKRSTAEMVLDILKYNKIRVDSKIANLVLAGIVAETKHLKLAGIETFRSIVDCMKFGANFPIVLSVIATPPDFAERIATIKAASRLELFRAGGWLIAVSSVASHEAAAARGLLKLGCDIGIVYSRKNNEIRISARSERGVLEKNKLNLARDVFSKIGKEIGGSGGGHDAAASANGRNVRNINRILDKIFSLLERKLGKIEPVN